MQGDYINQWEFGMLLGIKHDATRRILSSNRDKILFRANGTFVYIDRQSAINFLRGLLPENQRGHVSEIANNVLSGHDEWLRPSAMARDHCACTPDTLLKWANAGRFWYMTLPTPKSRRYLRSIAQRVGHG